MKTIMISIMTSLLLWTAALAAAAPVTGKKPAGAWLNNMDKAMIQARKAGRDILVNFSRSDGKNRCITLNREVFSQPYFLKHATQVFVLVELDFPWKKVQYDEQKKHNEFWKNRFCIREYPTIIYTDEEGKPYSTGGYLEGGATNYVTHVKEVANKRKTRDRALAAAEKAQGPEKAKQLDIMLDAVGKHLALNVYIDTAREIIILDMQNKTGLRAKYQKMIRDFQNERELEQLMRELTKRMNDTKDQDYLWVLRTIDVTLEEMELNGDALHNLQMMRVQCLVNLGRLASGLKELDTYIATAEDEKRKNAYRDQKIQILVLNDRNEEALKLLDSILALPGIDASYTARLQLQKAGLLEKTGKSTAALALYETLLKNKTDIRSVDFLKKKVEALKKKLATEKEVEK